MKHVMVLIFIFSYLLASGQFESASNQVPAQAHAASPETPNPNVNPAGYSITITVTNIRNRDGVIRFKFYDDSTPFPDLNGFLKIVVPKTEVTGDSLTLTFHGFKSQNMAIALLDDENNNVKLDFGWFLPKEGHAFSDYYHAALRRPVYEDFKFFLTGDKKVRMKMKYY